MQHLREIREFQKEGKLRNQVAGGAQNIYFHQVVLAIALCGQTMRSEDATEGKEALETFCHSRAHFLPLCVSVTRCPI